MHSFADVSSHEGSLQDNLLSVFLLNLNLHLQDVLRSHRLFTLLEIGASNHGFADVLEERGALGNIKFSSNGGVVFRFNSGHGLDNFLISLELKAFVGALEGDLGHPLFQLEDFR